MTDVHLDPRPHAATPPADAVRFDAHGLVPVIAQDVRTGRVLMLAWMNAEAYVRTRQTGDVWYYSRSRASLWRKGETSGHVQRLVELRHDCDHDALLAIVEQTGPACHTDRDSCFFMDGDSVVLEPPAGNMLDRLEGVLAARKSAPADTSYTRRLLDAGAAKITEKIREEAGEFCDAVTAESPDRVVSEMADVLYHTLVGLVSRGVPLADVYAELGRRFGVSGLVEKASRPTLT
jgi:phosphoribosyl-ATP pyrophosphohydrolase/phosphoribosyl-AMP cyclohydrolase